MTELEISTATSILDYEAGNPMLCPVCLNNMNEIGEEIFECKLCGEILDPLN